MANTIRAFAGTRIILEEFQTGIHNLQLSGRFGLNTKTMNGGVDIEENVMAFRTRVEEIPVEFIGNAIE